VTSEDVPVAILCGGRGIRLGSLTDDRPKPLVPVLGRPFLGHQIALLARQRFRRFVFLSGYCGDQVESWVRRFASSEGLDLVFSREEEPLGTGGALWSARAHLDGPFLLLNGDSYLDLDYRALLEALRGSPPGVVGAVAAFRNDAPAAEVEPNNLAVAPDGSVTLYQKRGPDGTLTHVDAGAAAYRPGIFDFFRGDDRRPLSLEETVWPRAIAVGGLRAFPAPERPWDIGTPARLAAFEGRLSEEASRAG
jgi:NDP-sugar pyrophosphorylase family protein